MSKMELKVTYLASCDLKAEFKDKSILPHIQILSLTGLKPENFKLVNGRFNSLACYGEVRVAYCVTKIFPHLRTRRFGPWGETHPARDMRTNPVTFNECVELPLPYCSLYDYSGICFVLCSTYTDTDGVHDQYLAGCHLFLYNSKKVFRSSIYELQLHSLQEYSPKSLDDALDCTINYNLCGKPKDMKELNHLLKKNRKQIRGEFFQTSIDQKTLAVILPQIEKLKQESDKMFICIKFEFSSSHPSLYIPVVFKRAAITSTDESQRLEKWNPYDEMYFKMTRNIRSIDIDRERTPNKCTLDRLKALIESGYEELLSEKDGDLIWKFRFYLANKFPEMALPKFLLSVRWEYAEQVSQAMELLLTWSSSVSLEAILELLTRKYTHTVCRRFAVSRLLQASNEDIELYLYQLVQALRYENHEEILLSSKIPTADTGCHEQNVGNVSPGSSHTAKEIGIESNQLKLPSRSKHVAFGPDNIPWKIDLATFLIQRGLVEFRLANYLYWFLQLEAHEDTSCSPEVKAVFCHVLKRFMVALECGYEQNRNWHSDLLNQTKFVSGLHRLLSGVQEDTSKRVRKIEMLKNLLRTEGASLTRFERPLPFPADPSFLIASIDADSATLFKSTTQPALLSLVSPEGQVHRIIFKIGDDLRQDQLVLQMIRLMDVVLKRERFDLKLTPYCVLAASCRHGFIQFINGISLADTKQEGSILTYLQRRAPSPSDPLGIQKNVLETYIRSCAGYCVITYLLGVGDRHMENIMLTPEGELFHIDFSFILGNDPKPMAPEVRLTKAMIEAMGGPKTPTFNHFVNICVTAFLSLRRHANLFLTLLSLVQDAGIHDIAQDPIKALDFVKDRFCLDQTDEKSASRFASRLYDSVKAIVPEMMERIHTVMQYMRN